jgi:hypothetical protein
MNFRVNCRPQPHGLIRAPQVPLPRPRICASNGPSSSENPLRGPSSFALLAVPLPYIAPPALLLSHRSVPLILSETARVAHCPCRTLHLSPIVRCPSLSQRQPHTAALALVLSVFRASPLHCTAPFSITDFHVAYHTAHVALTHCLSRNAAVRSRADVAVFSRPAHSALTRRAAPLSASPLSRTLVLTVSRQLRNVAWTLIAYAYCWNCRNSPIEPCSPHLSISGLAYLKSGPGSRQSLRAGTPACCALSLCLQPLSRRCPHSPLLFRSLAHTLLPSLSLSVSLSLCLSVSLSLCLSVSLSLCLFVSLSLSLSLCLFVSLPC